MPRKPKRPRLPNLLHLRPVLAKGKWYVYVQHHGRGKAYRITADYVTETNAFIEQYKDAVAQLERMPVAEPISDAWLPLVASIASLKSPRNGRNTQTARRNQNPGDLITL
jgi:hypothetical protein